MTPAPDEVGTILARLRIMNADGARVLVEDLLTVIENARCADATISGGKGGV